MICDVTKNRFGVKRQLSCLYKSSLFFFLPQGRLSRLSHTRSQASSKADSTVSSVGGGTRRAWRWVLGCPPRATRPSPNHPPHHCARVFVCWHPSSAVQNARLRRARANDWPHARFLGLRRNFSQAFKNHGKIFGWARRRQWRSFESSRTKSCELVSLSRL